MKIRLLSDLHLEGYPYYYEYKNEDLVVLAGDIHTAGRHPFILDQIPNNIPILMVAGNHEYYGSDFNSVNEWANSLNEQYPNFHFLENRAIKIGGVDFFGGTMFTDFNLYHDVETGKNNAKRGIADFSWIEKGNHRWTPEDHIEQHEIYCSNLTEFLKRDHAKRVVISHFVPHPLGSSEMFAGSPLNPYFVSDMTRFMGWDGLWLYGHTHSSKDMMVGNTRLVCNPKGYGSENSKEFIKDLIVEI